MPEVSHVVRETCFSSLGDGCFATARGYIQPHVGRPYSLSPRLPVAREPDFRRRIPRRCALGDPMSDVSPIARKKCHHARVNGCYATDRRYLPIPPPPPPCWASESAISTGAACPRVGFALTFAASAIFKIPDVDGVSGKSEARAPYWGGDVLRLVDASRGDWCVRA